VSRKIIIHDDAFDDLDTSSAVIGDYSSSASVRFLKEAQKAFRLLSDLPGLGAPRDYNNPDLNGMRMWPVSGFRKYLIFYLTTEDTIEIVRILHGSQNIQLIFSPIEG
jgi:toxin ParE1/3/4